MGLTKTQSGGLADDAKTTINNNADNRVITGSGTANTLNGESNVIVDGSGNIKIGETNSGAVRLSLTQESNGGLMISQGSGTTPTNGQTIGDIGFSSYSDSQTNSSSEAMIRALASADHTGSSAPTDLLFFTKPSSTGPGSSPTERVRLDSSGNLGVNTTAPEEKLGVAGNMRFVNPTGTTRRIIALPSGGYNVGTTGGSAIAFHRISEGGGGSDEIAFETHWQGNRHGESARISKFGGITFNGDTAAANALDDYEEGTFTVSLGGSWNSNPTNLAGAYVKIGRMVHIYVNFSGGSKSSTTSGYLQGLPFATTNYGTGSVVDSSVDNQGNCLFFNTNIIWLTDNSFNASTYVTGQYTTDD